jgi:hypothetical protein
MLLVETLKVSDKTLRERLGVVERNPSSSILGSNLDTVGHSYSGRLGTVKERDQSQKFSGALNEVRILFFLISHIVLTNLSRLRKT